MRFEPREYLERVFPALLAGSTLAPPKSVTVIQVVLSDRDDCDYFYRITEGGVDAAHGIADQADLTLSFYAPDLVAFSASELDVRRAVRSARITALGDRDILRWLAQRLEVEA